jgi:hypothetical protein
LVTRFRLEACFDIVASPPIPVRAVHESSQHDPTPKAAFHARLSHSLTCCSIFSFYSS